MQTSLLDAPNYSTATFPPPRPFQDTAHERLREGARAGHRCQLLMAPTGAGKTFLGMRIAHEALLRGKRAVFVCDRTTLINQTSDVADKYGLSAHGIIQADHWRKDRSLPFQIASVQTLARRNWPHADVVIVDECHTQHKAWTDYVANCDARVIGLSATPFSTGLGRLFTNLVNAATMRDLTESGVLVPMRVFSCTRPDMAGAETSGGEWTPQAASSRGMEIIGDVVGEWCKFASDRKTIVFGATIDHCTEICRQFNEAGVMAALFTSLTTTEERKALLDEYTKPDSAIRVLISVEALSKGFDVKDVGCVADCRPLRKSLSTAIQMWGRGLRSSPETGKVDCLLLDFSGNIHRFADDYENIFHNGLDALDAGEKLDKTIRRDEDKPDRQCPKCQHRPFARQCMACGFEVEASSLIVHEAGLMHEIMIGKKKAAANAEHLWAQACTHTRSFGKPETARSRARYLYQSVVGDFPPSAWGFDAVPNVQVTRAVLNKARANHIAYMHAIRRSA